MHIMLLCMNWLTACKTQRNHFHSVYTVLLRFRLEGFRLVWGTKLRKDMPQSERTVRMVRKHDQKGLDERHLFPRRMLKGKHDESLQISKRPLHRQVEKAVFPAHGRYIRCKLQQGSFRLDIFLSC